MCCVFFLTSLGIKSGPLGSGCFAGGKNLIWESLIEKKVLMIYIKRKKFNKTGHADNLKRMFEITIVKKFAHENKNLVNSNISVIFTNVHSRLGHLLIELGMKYTLSFRGQG